MKNTPRPLLAGGLAAALLLTACGQSQSTPGSTVQSMPAVPPASVSQAAPQVQSITPEGVQAAAQAGEAFILLDVRTAEEYAEAHIPGAVLLPLDAIGDAAPAQLPVQDVPLYIYCRSGNRSAQAAEKLAALGYTQVFDLGGIQSWPYETESGAWAQPEKDGTLTSFSTYTLDGVPIDEQLYANAPLTMVNVWATYCGPCLNEMPDLAQLAEDYAGKGLQVVGVVADVQPGADGLYPQAALDDARQLAQQTGAGYLHLLTSPDLASALQDTYAVPTTYFVNSSGQLVGETYVGARSAKDWAGLADALLAEVNA